ncbi:MAG: hypothetical protein WKF75_03910 [Singulisphaera sp.]
MASRPSRRPRRDGGGQEVGDALPDTRLVVLLNAAKVVETKPSGGRGGSSRGQFSPSRPRGVAQFSGEIPTWA